MTDKDKVVSTLPTQAEMETALDKPNNGLLMVELSPVEAIELRDYIYTLTFGDLTDATDNVPAALHSVYVALVKGTAS